MTLSELMDDSRPAKALRRVNKNKYPMLTDIRLLALNHKQ